MIKVHSITRNYNQRGHDCTIVKYSCDKYGVRVARLVGSYTQAAFIAFITAMRRIDESQVKA
jgi:hypothetical protein